MNNLNLNDYSRDYICFRFYARYSDENYNDFAAHRILTVSSIPQLEAASIA